MQDSLLNIKNNAVSLILEAIDHKELEAIKLQFIGRSGHFTAAIKNIAKLPKEKRPEVGILANEVKKIIEETIARREIELKEITEKHTQGHIDVTAPGIKPAIGHLHPLSQVLYEVVDVFKGLGFQAADGPEIETDYYNFEALNIPKDHPARDTQQTLYLDTRYTKINPGEILLRTQTSNMQGRVIEQMKPPLRVIVPGKVFRYEQVDMSHGFEFWQIEGFIVEKQVSLANLFGTLDYVFKQLFGKHTQTKFVCHNFPFVEPGCEAYVTCTVCKGKGCTFCKHSGWVEIVGAGIIHPNVLRSAGIDPKEWQGFAFGTGLSRMTTLRYQMDDLRLLTNPDLRILKQF